MAKANYSGLSDWYLAKLRQKADKRDQARLTPHTLVETDANLIKDLVSKAAVSRERRTHQVQEVLSKLNNSSRLAHKFLIWVSISGIVFLVYLSIRSFF